jgi:hypothetical protein
MVDLATLAHLGESLPQRRDDRTLISMFRSLCAVRPAPVFSLSSRVCSRRSRTEDGRAE